MEHRLISSNQRTLHLPKDMQRLDITAWEDINRHGESGNPCENCLRIHETITKHLRSSTSATEESFLATSSSDPFNTSSRIQDVLRAGPLLQLLHASSHREGRMRLIGNASMFLDISECRWH